VLSELIDRLISKRKLCIYCAICTGWRTPQDVQRRAHEYSFQK